MFKPYFNAATSNAPSVGSPITLQFLFLSDGGSILAPLQSAAISRSLSRDFVSPALSGSPFIVKSPTGMYPNPEPSQTRSFTQSLLTVISPLVIVPVLSVQITVTLPKVCTADNRLTRKCCLTIFSTLMAKALETVTCKPSGTQQTMTPIMKNLLVARGTFRK